MQIRSYKKEDRKQIEHIHFETGFVGSSMSKFLKSNKHYKKSIEYYVEKEPQSIFVLEDKNKVVGYLLGCLDDKNCDEFKEVITTILNGFFGTLFTKDNKYWRSQIRFIFKALTKQSDETKFIAPENAGHIHINLLPIARGKGYGSKLIQTFEKYAKKNNLKVYHADSFKTKLNKNQSFWLNNGFKPECEVNTSVWEKQIKEEKTKLVCYVKRL
jgi:GNAT superfamily N-acetyltransferase